MNRNCKKLIHEFKDKGWWITVPKKNFIAVQYPVDSNIPKDVYIRCSNIRILVFATVSISDLDTDMYTLPVVLVDRQNFFDKYGVKMTIKDGLLISSLCLFSPPIPPYMNALFGRVVDSMGKCGASLDIVIDGLEFEKKYNNIFRKKF